MSTPKLISFSGMDGSGKSTQISNLRSLLEASGLRVVQLSFWDDVVVLCRYREAFSLKVLKSEPGVGSPERPVARRDKNVRKWYLTFLRHILYFLDTLRLNWVVAKGRRSRADVIIFDRYIYDQLANLPLSNPVTRAYISLIRGLAPAPDLAYFLDAEPEAARRRKPEYPVDFLLQNRAAYLEVARMLNGVVIPPLPLPEAKQAVINALLPAMRREIPAGSKRNWEEQTQAND